MDSVLALKADFRDGTAEGTSSAEWVHTSPVNVLDWIFFVWSKIDETYVSRN